jgi:hypothetical protein
MNSEDNDRVGEYVFHMNTISIGSNIKNEIYLPYSDVSKVSFHLDCSGSELIITPHQDVISFHVNGKLTTTHKSLKAGDTFSYNATKFQIVSFQIQDNITEQELVNSLIENIDPSDAELTQLISLLS